MSDAGLHRSSDSSIIQRRRQHVMSELLSTERDYLHDLDLLIETFLQSNAIACVRHLEPRPGDFMPFV